MEIDPQLPIPLYFQLKTLLLEEILGGRYDRRRAASDRARALRAVPDQSDARDTGALGAGRRGRDSPAPAARFVRQPPLAEPPTRSDGDPRHRPDGRALGTDGPRCRRRTQPDQRRAGAGSLAAPHAHARRRRRAGAGHRAPRQRVGSRVRSCRVHPRARGTERELGRRRARGRLPRSARAREPVRRQDLRRLALRGRRGSLVSPRRPRIAGPRAPCDLERPPDRRPCLRGGRSPEPDRHARRLARGRGHRVLPDRIPGLERCAGARPGGSDARFARDGSGAPLPQEPRRGGARSRSTSSATSGTRRSACSRTDTRR